MARNLAAWVAYSSGFNALRNLYLRMVDGPTLRVLVYHEVKKAPSRKDTYSVSAARFEEQMIFLKNNFNVITFEELLRTRERAGQVTDSAIVTFDDGYKSNFTEAVPILNRHNLKACFFLTTELLGHVPDSHRAYQKGEIWRSPGLTWEDVKCMLDMGFEIGAHSVHHRNLLHLPPDLARREILESKEILEQRLGTEIRYFAYPGGKRNQHFNEGLKRIVAENFAVCCTTVRGRNSLSDMDLMEVYRICAQNWWSPFIFARELEGTFDFIGSRTYDYVSHLF